jgi:hypothetical protein
LDTGGGAVSSVQITLQRDSDSLFWTGSIWAGAIWLPASGTTSWTFTIDDALFGNGINYTVSARAFDTAGNITTTGYGSTVFLYDSLAPVAIANNANSNWFISRNTTLSATDSGGVGIAIARYKWDILDFNAACTTGGTATYINGESIVVPAGSHRLYLCTADMAGNVGTSDSGADQYRVDAIAPGTEVTIANLSYGPISFIHDSTINGTATDNGDSGVASVQITIRRDSDLQYFNGSGWQAGISWLTASGTTAWTYSIIDETYFGNAITYTVQARATDTAGNTTSSGLGTDSFIYDNSGPTTASIFANPSSGTHMADQEFVVTIGVDGDGEQFTSFGATVNTTNLTIVSLTKGSSVSQWTTEPNSGSLSFFGAVTGSTGNVTVYTLTVKGIASGIAQINITDSLVLQTDGINVVEIPVTPVSGSYTINTVTAPSSLVLYTPATSPGNVPAPVITVGGVANGDTVRIYTDGTCTTPVGTAVSSGATVNITSSTLTQGSYIFKASLTNSLGSLSPCSTATVAYELDTTLPVVITGGAQHMYPNINRTFTATSTDNNSGIDTNTWIKQAETRPATVTFGNATGLTTTAKANTYGTFTLRLTAVDKAGNSGYGETSLIIHKNGDIDNDGYVDNDDYTLLMFNWGDSPLNDMADFTREGLVDNDDFTILMYWWEEAPDYSLFTNQSLCITETSGDPCLVTQPSAVPASTWSNTATNVWKDNRTGLYWSEYKGGMSNSFTTGCGFFSTTPRGNYDGTGCGNAIDYCAGLSQVAVSAESAKTDWYLPTIKELQQAQINDIYNKAGPAFTPSYYYWSSSEVSYLSSKANYFYTSLGITWNNNKTATEAMRCVRRD